MNTVTLYVTGIHCSACKMLIEDILLESPHITKATVSMAKQIVVVELTANECTPAMLAEINTILAPHNYTLSYKKQVTLKDNSLINALPIGLIFLVLFFWLQKSGLIDVSFTGEFSAFTALGVGVVASLSSCLAIVGGLILTLSARVAQDNKKIKPHVLFHGSRMLSFMLLGALLGALGSAIAINTIITATLGVLASLVMVVLGINLLDVFHSTKQLGIRLPKNIKIISIEHSVWAPCLVGAFTFFLPCGFTQSMQILALSSQSWLQGAIIMTMFALGTLPMLLVISFSSYTFAKSNYAPVFFKSVGIIVIGLGVFGLLTGLAGLGIVPPLFTL